MERLLLGTNIFMTSILHWIFAVEYFKTSQMFPVIMSQDRRNPLLAQKCVTDKLKDIDCMVKAANIIFYVLLLGTAVWVLLSFFVLNEDQQDS